MLRKIIIGVALVLFAAHSHTAPLSEKGLDASTAAKGPAPVFDKKVAKDMEFLRSQPDIARRDPSKIPQIMALMRDRIDGSENPEYFNRIAVDVSNALLDSAFAENDPQLQMDIINNYIVNLFPKTGIDASLTKFVGRSLEVAEYNHNEDLLDKINRAFFSTKTPINYAEEQWLLQRGMLDHSYHLASVNLIYINDYLWLSSQLRSDKQAEPNLATTLATHYTRLLIKSLKEKNYKAGKRLGKTYMDKIYPVTGYSGKSTDVISHILVLGLLSNDEQVSSQAMRDFVENANYDRARNKIFLFNIACYYARHGDKANMLDAIKLSINYGHNRESFLSDSDFKAFRADPEFGQVVATATQGKQNELQP